MPPELLETWPQAQARKVAERSQLEAERSEIGARLNALDARRQDRRLDQERQPSAPRRERIPRRIRAGGGRPWPTLESRLPASRWTYG